MTSAYETSYDVGLKPFNHDKNRGTWSSPKDFFFACVGQAFKNDMMFTVPSLVFGYTGFFALFPAFIMLILCTLPIILIQSFLGQFSSTGFISAFRIAPLFKGIGYVALAVNLLTLTFYSIYGAIPLFYFFHSLRPVLPWSCEGTKSWLNLDNRVLACNLTNGMVLDVYRYSLFNVPSQQFFMSHMNAEPAFIPLSLLYSWQLVFCTVCIWSAVWFVLTKRTEVIGRILRCSTATVVAIMTVCVIRLGFLPGAFSRIQSFSWEFSGLHVLRAYITMPLLSFGGLGPGWGSTLSMASYNKFRTDITKHSWLLCLGQAGLVVLANLVWLFVDNFWTSMGFKYLRLPDDTTQWLQLVTVPSALSTLEMPHVWSLLFFGMMAAGIVNLMIVQLFSVVTSLFDEFEPLRRMRRGVLTLFAVVLCICSLMFCTNHGLISLGFVSRHTVLTQILLNLMLLLVVLWVYGRERFQRDIFFMTGRTYFTWMVNVVRIVAPIILIFSFLLVLLVIINWTEFPIGLFTLVSIVFMTIVPWLLIPGYCLFKLSQVDGYIVRRFKRCVRPTDWYPGDPEERQRYEEAFNRTDLSHQLTTTGEEEGCNRTNLLHQPTTIGREA